VATLSFIVSLDLLLLRTKLRMVCIKHIARPKVLSKPPVMAPGDEMVVPLQEVKESPTTSSSATSDGSEDCGGGSGSSGSNAFESDESGQMKVAAAAGITFDFGLSTVKQTRIASMESCAQYFPWGYFVRRLVRSLFHSTERTKLCSSRTSL
jgi:hypothetical protein